VTQEDYEKYLVNQLLSAAISFCEIAKTSDDPVFIRECLANAEKALAEAVSASNARAPNRCKIFTTRSARAQHLIKKLRARVDAATS